MESSQVDDLSPILAGVLAGAAFIMRDELSRSHSPTILLVVSTLKESIDYVLGGLIALLLLCIVLWGIADYFDRPEVWRTRR